MATYIRISDGGRADAAEACTADGKIRPGYRSNFIKPGDYIGFDMAFLDKRSDVVKDGERSRITSGDELKRRNGLGGLARDFRLIQARYHRRGAAATLV